jgi:hypothetical protein
METGFAPIGTAMNGCFYRLSRHEKRSLEIGARLNCAQTEGHAEHRVRVIEQVIRQAVWERWGVQR